MKKFHKLFLLIVLLPVCCFAQTNDDLGIGPHVKIFASAGLSAYKMSPSGTFPFYNESAHSGVSPRASFGINFSPRPEIDRIIIKAEFAYSSAAYKTKVNLYFTQPNDKTDFSFGQHTFSVIPQLQSNVYNGSSVKVYINGGVSFNFSGYTGNSINNSQSGVTEDHYLTLNSRWISVPLKAGIVISKHIDLWANYSFPINITDDSNSPSRHQNFDYKLKISTTQAGLSYIF